jgi:hypothetical protein
MEKRHFITVSLLLTALAANPLLANKLNPLNQSTLRQANIITSQITLSLHKRGLDEDAADSIVKEFVDGEDHLDAKISNFLDIYKKITHSELIDHLSTVALNREKVAFESYDNLMGLARKIKGTHLDANELKKLRTVSNINKLLC